MYQKIKVVSALFVFVIVVCLSPQETEAQPYRILQRQKRISDQRLAELQTLVALSKMKGKMVTIPVGFGLVDPEKLGRRRRSAQSLLQQLLEQPSSKEKEVEKEDDIKDNLLYALLFRNGVGRSPGFRPAPDWLPE